MVIADDVVRTGHQRGDVRADARRRREVHGLAGGEFLDPSARRAFDATSHESGTVAWNVNARLEVGLVEAGVDALGVGGLELAVQVGLAVDRVDEAVQSLAGVRVEHLGLDDHSVVAARDRPARCRSEGS